MSKFILEDDDMVTDNIDKTILKEEQDKPMTIPSGYIPVKLATNGKLGYPKVLHFRNYSMKEALDLASVTEDREPEVIASCLQSMLFEKDIEVKKLHNEDIKVIMLYLIKNFWNNDLDSMPYHIDNTLKGKELDNINNVAKTSISISKLTVNTLDIKGFKEPINVKIDKKTVMFKLPRLEDIILSKRYVRNKHRSEFQKFEKIKNILEHNARQTDETKKLSYDLDELEQYNEFQERIVKDYLMVLECSMIYGIDGEELNLDKKVDKFSEIDMMYWVKFNNLLTNKLNFGIEPNISFYCNENKKEVSRRFTFRFTDFIPNMEEADSNDDGISFG